MHVAEKYARDVVAGRVPRCEWAILACERFLRDIEHEDYYFDDVQADKVINFVECFKHYKGKQFAGKRIELVDDQKFVISAFFGIKKKKDNNRKYQYLYLEVPRKYGKTLLIAALGVYLIYGDGEPGAEVYCIATKMDIASRMWMDCKKLIEKSGYDDFIEDFHITNSPKQIYDNESDSYIVPLGKDKGGESSDGLNPHGILWDEVHALKDYDYFTVMNSATGARDQPVFIMITTAGKTLTTVGYDQNKFSKRVLKGETEGLGDNYFTLIHTINDKDIEAENFEDPAVWEYVHPLYNITVNEEKYKNQFSMSKANPNVMRETKTKWLNMWLNEASAWLKSEDWTSCKNKDIKPEDLKGLRCYGGLDLSLVNDLSAFVLVFPPQEGLEKYYIMPFFWCPTEDIHTRTANAGIPYFQWSEQGFMKPIAGKTFDDEVIRRDIQAIIADYECVFIGYDRTYSHTLVNKFEDEVCEMLEFNQGMVYISPPTKELERLVIAGEVWHPDNPVLNWNFGNALVIFDTHENMKVDKKRSSEKVDGAVAAIMALGVCLNEEGDEREFFVETW